MAALTTNVVPITGLRMDDKFVAASGGGDTCETGAGVELVVRNASGSSINVTIAVPELVDGDLVIGSRVVAVPATTGQMAIPITSRYRNTSTGVANITYSAVTSVTVMVKRGMIT